MSLLLGQTDHRYITTVDVPYPGYLVQIPSPTNAKKMVLKVFAGEKYTLDHYFAAALAWRDMTYMALYAKPIPLRIFHGSDKGETDTPPGVRHIVKKVRYKCKSGDVRIALVPCIIAEIHTIVGHDYQRPKGARSRLFSIKKYGEAEAIRLATACRREMERQLEMTATMRHANGDEAAYRRSTAARNVQELASQDPGRLIDTLMRHLQCTSHRALALRLQLQPEILSKIRHKKLRLGDSVLLRMHEVSEIPINELRRLAKGDVDATVPAHNLTTRQSAADVQGADLD